MIYRPSRTADITVYFSRPTRRKTSTRDSHIRNSLS